MSHTQANAEDYQRLFYCAPPGGKWCGLPPCSGPAYSGLRLLAYILRLYREYLRRGMTSPGCSSPPCLDCFAGQQLYAKKRPGCAAEDKSIGCVPPETAMGYKGQHWPTTEINGTGEMHIFLIGDWGGLDGTLDTAENRPEMIAYDWGRQPGPSVFPRSRWNKPHTEQLCGHKQFVECFNTRGQPPCIPDCGYVPGRPETPKPEPD